MARREHDHNHERADSLHAPVISKRWRNMTVIGNLVFGAMELLGGRTNTLAVTIDGIHNVGDAATYQLQAGDLLHRHPDEERLLKRRKIAHWVIATGSAAFATKAGLDFVNGSESIVEPLALWASGGSVMLNVALAGRLMQGVRREHASLQPDDHCHEEKDIVKHMALDSASAVAAFGGALLQKHGLNGAEQLIACASGVVGMIAFRPTEANLDHHH